jgi:uncharacterized protein (TIGR03083 family)
MFRPVSGALDDLLRTLAPADWERSTLAGSWTVRDVVAHLLDGALRRLSFHRDRLPPPVPDSPIVSDRDFVEFINRLNAEWVRTARRFSPRVLTDLYARSASELADFFESLPMDTPALFPVSWAGEAHSAGWFDIGREFTEVWHHQQQIRLAVGAASLSDPRYLDAVIDLAMRSLPHSFRDVKSEPGATVVVDVTDFSDGGRWTLARNADQWSLWVGEPPDPTARVRMSRDAAWRLFFNALPAEEARALIDLDGATALARHVLRARSVIV